MLLYFVASSELSGSPTCCDSFSVEERGVTDGLHDNMPAWQRRSDEYFSQLRKAISGALDLNAQKILQRTQVFQGKISTEIPKQSINSGRGGTDNNNINNIDEYEHSDNTFVLEEQRYVGF
jgi:hypothetical protein